MIGKIPGTYAPVSHPHRSMIRSVYIFLLVLTRLLILKQGTTSSGIFYINIPNNSQTILKQPLNNTHHHLNVPNFNNQK